LDIPRSLYLSGPQIPEGMLLLITPVLVFHHALLSKLKGNDIMVPLFHFQSLSTVCLEGLGGISGWSGQDRTVSLASIINPV